MTSVPKPHDRRRSEVLEALVQLYLRLNGYFCIANYLQHRIEGFGPHTESDVLAIRMPYQEEVLQDGRRQPNDESLVLPEGSAAIDCIVGEVKEPSIEFNKSFRGPDGRHRICAALQMFGVFPREAFGPGGVAAEVVDELHTAINANAWPDHPRGYTPDQKVCVRLIVFAPTQRSTPKTGSTSICNMLWTSRSGECVPVSHVLSTEVRRYPPPARGADGHV